MYEVAALATSNFISIYVLCLADIPNLDFNMFDLHRNFFIIWETIDLGND